MRLWASVSPLHKEEVSHSGTASVPRPVRACVPTPTSPLTQMNLAPKAEAPVWRLTVLGEAIPDARQTHPLLCPSQANSLELPEGPAPQSPPPSVLPAFPGPQLRTPPRRGSLFPVRRCRTLPRPAPPQTLHRAPRASLTTEICVLVEYSLLSPSHPTQLYSTQASQA